MNDDQLDDLKLYIDTRAVKTEEVLREDLKQYIDTSFEDTKYYVDSRISQTESNINKRFDELNDKMDSGFVGVGEAIELIQGRI